jgi:hypothetical protein
MASPRWVDLKQNDFRAATTMTTLPLHLHHELCFIPILCQLAQYYLPTYRYNIHTCLIHYATKKPRNLSDLI